MADKLMYPIGSFKYANRMMKAGDDPVLMNARDQALYLALKKVTADKPRVARAAPVETPAPKAPRKRTARRKK